MSTDPTDPLPEPCFWYEYAPTGWGVRLVRADGSNEYQAWTFNPSLFDVEWPVEGYEGDKPDVWVVRGRGASAIGNRYCDAVFPTRDEATHYISVRAMLNTFDMEKE
jgi:hypothetical protein